MEVGTDKTDLQVWPTSTPSAEPSNLEIESQRNHWVAMKSSIISGSLILPWLSSSLKAFLPIFCIREANGQLTMEVKSPLEIKWTGDLRSDVQTNTQMITDAVEKAVRKHPDQWFWVHKRWKKYYPQQDSDDS